MLGRFFASCWDTTRAVCKSMLYRPALLAMVVMSVHWDWESAAGL